MTAAQPPHFALVVSYLRQGYGVEDIAVETSLTEYEVRRVVRWFRGSGDLRAMYANWKREWRKERAAR